MKETMPRRAARRLGATRLLYRAIGRPAIKGDVAVLFFVAIGGLVLFGSPRGASAQTGPIVTFFGAVSLQGVPVPCSEVLEHTPVCPVASGTGFYLIAEGRPGSAPVGMSTFNPDGLPDLQIQTEHSLGNGSPAVCDSQLPSLGGVAPVSPPDLAFSDPGPVNDFACRFSTDPCTLNPFGEAIFLDFRSTIQFCATIDSLIGFASGDTRVSLRLRDTNGNLSSVRQIIVRVAGANPTATPTPSSTSIGGASPTPTRTATSTTSASPSATATPTRTASAAASPTSTSTSAGTATASPTPTVTASPTTPGTSPTPTPSGVPPLCAGDCNQNLIVTVDELIRGIRIALGSLSLAECPDLDANNDGRVTIDEPVLAVHRALNRCPL